MSTLTADWQDYALLDSGQGRKLERFGPVTLIRPEAQASWQPALPRADWDAAHAVFEASSQNGGRWLPRQPLPPRWEMGYGALRFWVQASQRTNTTGSMESTPNAADASSSSNNPT